MCSQKHLSQSKTEIDIDLIEIICHFILTIKMDLLLISTNQNTSDDVSYFEEKKERAWSLKCKDLMSTFHNKMNPIQPNKGSCGGLLLVIFLWILLVCLQIFSQ